MSVLAANARVNGVVQGWTYGSDPNNGATWDHDNVFACLCDDGFAGYDCRQRLCPTGDDVTTYGQVTEIQSYVCTMSGAAGNTFVIRFREHTTDALEDTISASDLKLALESLESIGEVNVEYATGKSEFCQGDDSNKIAITFLSNHGDLPLLQFEQYDPSGAWTFDFCFFCFTHSMLSSYLLCKARWRQLCGWPIHPKRHNRRPGVQWKGSV